MKKIIIAISAVLLALSLNSCRAKETIDPDLEIKGLGSIDYARTDIDDWLDEAFLDLYNIQVIYRWNASDVYTGVTKKLIPPKVSKIKPMMSTIAKVWFEPYQYVAGYGFLQKYAPKTIVLAGSPEYQNSTGNAMVLGTAEGAVKIFLTNVNAFNPQNRSNLVEYMHVIEHEFSHVLTQAINYKPTFGQITRQWYDPTGWGNLTDEDAYVRGFISKYAMSSPGEDFAEMLSLVLVYGYDWFQNTVLTIAEGSTVNASAKENLIAKLQEVEVYMRTNFGIELHDNLETGKKGFINAVQEAIDYVLENPIEY